MAESAFTQEEFLNKMRPVLKTEGRRYRKFRPILARPAQPGEQVETVTADGVETTNQAQPGDFLVQNQTAAREEYLVPEETFARKYRLLRTADQGFSEYEPLGRIVALELTSEHLAALQLPESFHFNAKWGEPMKIQQGDFLAAPPDFSEVYRIARQEFFETYEAG